MENFYEGIVKNLKSEANKLSGTLVIATNRNDTQLYIATIKSLRDTLDLINKYDWRLMYSEYGLDSSNESKQVAIWEQNHDNQIRNHKVWDVTEAVSLVSKCTKESGKEISEAVRSISKN